MKQISDLDKIGLEAARVLQGMDGQRRLAQPLVKEIFAAFEEAKKNKVKIVINGAKGKTQWAEEFAKVSLRYCQQIRRDGTRKNEDTNRGSRPKTANLDTADFVILGGQKFEAREFAEAIWVALTADGSKRERTERTLNLRERLWEAGDAWETAHGADFTNEHLKEHAREEEAKAEAKKQAKKPKVHFKDEDGKTCPVARKRGSKCLTTTVEAEVACAACLGTIESKKEFNKEVEERRKETHGTDAKNHLTRCRWFLLAETKVSYNADEITCEDCKKIAYSLGATSMGQAPETAAAAD